MTYLNLFPFSFFGLLQTMSVKLSVSVEFCLRPLSAENNFSFTSQVFSREEKEIAFNNSINYKK
jgi:hypothetical protein